MGSLLVVLDTNVWISGIFFRGGPPAALLRAWRDKRFEIVLTPEVLDELEQKLREKSVQFTSDQALGEEWIAYIKTFAQVVRVSVTVEGVCRDQDDDKFLAAALSANASYVISGDYDLQVLEQHQGVKVLSPREFVDLLAKANPHGS
jgi:putative PIN family toxin of toxin-antitoxin system